LVLVAEGDPDVEVVWFVLDRLRCLEPERGGLLRPPRFDYRTVVHQFHHGDISTDAHDLSTQSDCTPLGKHAPLHLSVTEEVKEDVAMGGGIGVAFQEGIEKGVARQGGRQYGGDALWPAGGGDVIVKDSLLGGLFVCYN